MKPNHSEQDKCKHVFEASTLERNRGQMICIDCGEPKQQDPCADLKWKTKFDYRMGVDTLTIQDIQSQTIDAHQYCTEHNAAVDEAVRRTDARWIEWCRTNNIPLLTPPKP